MRASAYIGTYTRPAQHNIYSIILLLLCVVYAVRRSCVCVCIVYTYRCSACMAGEYSRTRSRQDVPGVYLVRASRPLTENSLFAFYLLNRFPHRADTCCRLQRRHSSGAYAFTHRDSSAAGTVRSPAQGYRRYHTVSARYGLPARRYPASTPHDRRPTVSRNSAFVRSVREQRSRYGKQFTGKRNDRVRHSATKRFARETIVRGSYSR